MGKLTDSLSNIVRGPLALYEIACLLIVMSNIDIFKYLN